MEDKDEYICSLLLSLFLMQGEIDRLNQTLDLARKGELVYINNPQNAALKAENVNLREKITNIERIAREGHKDYYYIYTKNNPFFLNIIKEIEK